MSDRDEIALTLEITLPLDRWTAWEAVCAAYGRDPEQAFGAALAGAAEVVLREALGEEDDADEDASDDDSDDDADRYRTDWHRRHDGY